MPVDIGKALLQGVGELVEVLGQGDVWCGGLLVFLGDGDKQNGHTGGGGQPHPETVEPELLAAVGLLHRGLFGRLGQNGRLQIPGGGEQFPGLGGLNQRQQFFVR